LRLSIIERQDRGTELDSSSDLPLVAKTLNS
jgi:hypothetical protein